MDRTFFLLALAASGCVAGSPSEEDPIHVVRGDRADGQGVYRTSFRIDQGYAQVEVLDDDLIHVEFGAGRAPSDNTPIRTSPMVHRADYTGPTRLRHIGNVIETSELRAAVNEFGCIDTTRLSDGAYLTTVCPVNLREGWKGISLDPREMQNVYGLGQYFRNRGSADGDWTSHGRFRTDGEFGNHFRDFWGGANPQIQFPVMYALGAANQGFGLFLDNVYKQDWDFDSDAWWQVRMYGDQVRFYIMAGDDLRDIRSDYMELSGRPPVPPRKAFGLWVSEFGYDSWNEVDGELAELRGDDFPVDGFMLDLQWFGSTWENSPDSPMGGLRWDERNFPSPREKIASYRRDHVGIMTIEESYVSEHQPSYGEMNSREGMAHVCNSDNRVQFTNWMGRTGMIDWSKRSAAEWWHDNLRRPNIIDMGVMGHWTDLGEPERYDGNACYRGLEDGKYHHGDIHNLYNFLWHESIYDGYVRNQTAQRPFLLSRSGAPGMQRFGAAMWSGDIASRLDVLATHQNAAMHMSFAGIDYYGADVGGFWRRAVWDDTNRSGGNTPNVDEMYTQWLANAAWFDVPLRPHTFNCGFSWFSEPSCPHETNPARVGHKPSNLANVRQRYELIPYYYSLAHRAYEAGEPLIAPVVMNYENDPAVRQMGHERMIGRDLIVGVVASYGENARRMYLPAGRWFDWFTGEVVDSSGQWTGDLPTWRDGVFRLPAFARSGAIIPMMQVDDSTLDAFGSRSDGTVNTDLVAAIFADATESEFTLYEDDGSTVAEYDDHREPVYDTRVTRIHQVLTAEGLVVTIDPAEGTYGGAPDARTIELRVRLPQGHASAVEVEGEVLAPSSEGAGWREQNGVLRVRTTARDVRSATKIFVRL